MDTRVKRSGRKWVSLVVLAMGGWASTALGGVISIGPGTGNTTEADVWCGG